MAFLSLSARPCLWASRVFVFALCRASMRAYVRCENLLFSTRRHLAVSGSETRDQGGGSIPTRDETFADVLDFPRIEMPVQSAGRLKSTGKSRRGASAFSGLPVGACREPLERGRKVVRVPRNTSPRSAAKLPPGYSFLDSYYSPEFYATY